MIPLTLVRGYDTTLTQLSTAALADLRALMNSLGDVDPARAQAVLQEAFPEVFNPYAAASSAVSASFYEEVREYAEVRGRFDAETLDSVDAGRYGALVGWGARPSVFERGGQALAFSLLSGGLTQILTEMSADTIIGNAALDPAPIGYQRVPRAGCCTFCGMLASRGAAYSSEGAAGGVVGRGMEVPKVKRRGGQAKGIRARGSRQMGERFHDDCKCRAVPVNEGNAVQMQSDADKYFNAYADARNEVSGVRKADGYQGYGDQATSQKMILAKMRETLNAK
jgi:hypothetical protein